MVSDVARTARSVSVMVVTSVILTGCMEQPPEDTERENQRTVSLQATVRFESDLDQVLHRFMTTQEVHDVLGPPTFVEVYHSNYFTHDYILTNAPYSSTNVVRFVGFTLFYRSNRLETWRGVHQVKR